MELKVRRGWLVEITFLDHSLEFKGSKKSTDPMVHKVWGIVHSITPKTITVINWLCDSGGKQATEDNSEHANIIRSTILDIKRLEYTSN